VLSQEVAEVVVEVILVEVEMVVQEALVEVEMERDLVQQLQEQLIQAVVAVDQDIFVVVQIQELVDLV
jgi:hypothetical protein